MINKDLEIIIDKLEAFIKKYYKNSIIRGFIFLILLSSSYFLLITSIEFYAHFSTKLRMFLFLSFIGINATILIYSILIPFLKIYKIGKRLDYYTASKIIAKHFPEIDDKIINILELGEETKVSSGSKELILKSISQKSNELKPVSFTKAVNLKENLRYAKYLIPVAAISIFIFIFNPSIITDGAKRVIHYDKHYKIEAPYQFVLLSDSLNIEKGKDIKIELELRGNEIPDRIYIKYGGVKYLMKKESKRKFSYNFYSLNNDIDFYFTDEIYTSDIYKIRALPTPAVVSFNIDVYPPKYTGVKAFNLQNIGDLSVPEGSKIIWEFNTKYTDSLILLFNDSIKLLPEKRKNYYRFEKIAKNDAAYSINIKNKFITKDKLLKYNLLVSKDLYPEIRLQIINDSINPSQLYFSGVISDDYGFKTLKFRYKQKNSDKIQSIDIPINKNINTQEYFYAFDFNTINATSDIEYYFEVFDNDAVNGSKSAKTTKYTYHKLSDKEIENIEQEKSENINSKLSESKKLTEEIKKDIADLQKDLLNNKNSEWENQQKLKNIIEKQKRLEKLLDQAAKENKDKNKLSDNYDEKSKELIEKQKEIEKLMDEVMDDEMKKLLEELQKLMEDFDEKKLNELSKDYEMSLEELNKQLDRNLEQLKQLEVEKKLEKTVNQLEELAKKQKDLSDKTAKTSKKDEKALEEIKQQEKEQNDKFEQLKDDFQELLKKNEELENPMRIDDFDEEMKKIEDQFKNTNQELQNSNNKKASKSQKQNSQQLQELSQKMQSMMQSGQAQQNSENIEDLKQILENLITFSINQEKLIKESKNLNSRDPRKVEITEEQNKIINDFKLIEDSLYALSKRVPQLNSTINKQVLYIKKQSSYLIDEMEDNRISQARVRQQNIMTSANELALLLDEIMQQMKKAQQQCSGNSNCSKPGGGKPSLSQMRKQQESLKKQLEGMIKDMKGKPKNGKNGQKVNKNIAEMLAKQEIFQNQLSELMRNSNLSPKEAKKLNEINAMIEEMKRDLVNKNITPELLKRQDQILTRLLEAENSEYEREQDKKRKAEQAEDKQNRMPPNLEKYKKSKQGFDEILIYRNLKLNKYYNEKYKQYILELNE